MAADGLLGFPDFFLGIRALDNNIYFGSDSGSQKIPKSEREFLFFLFLGTGESLKWIRIYFQDFSRARTRSELIGGPRRSTGSEVGVDKSDFSSGCLGFGLGHNQFGWEN